MGLGWVAVGENDVNQLDGGVRLDYSYLMANNNGAAVFTHTSYAAAISDLKVMCRSGWAVCS